MRDTIHRCSRLLPAVFILASACVFASQPPDLPGDDISGEYLQRLLPPDSISVKEPPSASKTPATWLQEAEKTWEAPSLAQQIASDNTNIPVGKGAIFIPRLSELGLEPAVEILDSAGTVVGEGNTGRNYAVLPGRYYVIHGSGSQHQRLVHTVDVTEGRSMPIVPGWAGLSINVVDENGIAFRGEYELTPVDSFAPFGRSYGPDPSLGEETKTWILKPGLYKIMGPDENNTTTSTIAVLLNSWFRYEKPPYNWSTSLKLDEGFALSEISLTNPGKTVIEPNIDEPRLTSLFIWRVLSWFGPYGRFEATSTIFPKRVFPDQINNKPFFYLLNDNGYRDQYDTISAPREREPSFSPTELTGSVGANMDLVKVRYVDARLRTGFAYEFIHTRKYYEIVDVSTIPAAVRQSDSLQISRSTVLMPISAMTENAIGPEAAAVLDVRVGGRATAKSEVRLFLPIVPAKNRGMPKLDIISILSWQISRVVTLDYQYTYSFCDIQVLGKKKESEHRLILRYSYTSR